MMELMANIKNTKTQKSDVNVKIKNIWTRRFDVSMADVSFAVYILFCSFEISDNILRNQK